MQDRRRRNRKAVRAGYLKRPVDGSLRLALIHAATDEAKPDRLQNVVNLPLRCQKACEDDEAPGIRALFKRPKLTNAETEIMLTGWPHK
ncbi:hypothetical protein FHS76_004201 [Ochrobactrum daejeonense]|uniref:Uncharacterized protein n=1 Tax=Brucella daejeonensis TaxID=659015 RepID=A0A7W9B1V3_9HYPH|nr:hypothetical protein [Brucella daejeonensis]